MCRLLLRDGGSGYVSRNVKSVGFVSANRRRKNVLTRCADIHLKLRAMWKRFACCLGNPSKAKGFRDLRLICRRVFLLSEMQYVSCCRGGVRRVNVLVKSQDIISQENGDRS